MVYIIKNRSKWKRIEKIQEAIAKNIETPKTDENLAKRKEAYKEFLNYLADKKRIPSEQKERILDNVSSTPEIINIKTRYEDLKNLIKPISQGIAPERAKNIISSVFPETVAVANINTAKGQIEVKELKLKSEE